MIDESTVKAIANLGADHTGKTIPTADGGSLVLLPEGWHTEKVPPLETALTHTKAFVTLQDKTSFINYVTENKTDTTKLFIDVDNAKMTAILDYHAAPTDLTEGAPGRLAHVVVYQMKLAEEWKRWTGIEGKNIPQVDFATFIEENIENVLAPSGAEMLEISLFLQAKKNVTFKSGVRLQNGNTELAYSEETEAAVRGKGSVPTEITIALPVFFGGEAYRVKCFLRYNISDGGKLTFRIDMNRRAFIYQDAVMQDATEVGTSTDLTPFYGTVAGVAGGRGISGGF